MRQRHLLIVMRLLAIATVVAVFALSLWCLDRLEREGSPFGRPAGCIKVLDLGVTGGATGP